MDGAPRDIPKEMNGIKISHVIPRLLSISEAADYLGIGKTEAYRSLRAYVEPVMNGKRILFPREELDRFIDEAKQRGSLFYYTK